jgi:hypothetical protein
VERYRAVELLRALDAAASVETVFAQIESVLLL